MTQGVVALGKLRRVASWDHDYLRDQMQLRKGIEERYRPPHEKLFPEASRPCLVTTVDASRRLVRRTIDLVMCKVRSTS